MPVDPTDPAAEREDLFWELAEELYSDPDVTRSTMMGLPCLRWRGKFFASLDRDPKHLIVKVSKERVDALVVDGVGVHFAPAGRVFREWVSLPVADEGRWRELLTEAKEMATRSE